MIKFSKSPGGFKKLERMVSEESKMKKLLRETRRKSQAVQDQKLLERIRFANKLDLSKKESPRTMRPNRNRANTELSNYDK